MATVLHCKEGSIKSLTRTAASLLASLSYYSSISCSFLQKLLPLFQCALKHPFHHFHCMKCSCQGSKSLTSLRSIPAAGRCDDFKHWWLSLLHLSGFTNSCTSLASFCHCQLFHHKQCSSFI